MATGSIEQLSAGVQALPALAPLRELADRSVSGMPPGPTFGDTYLVGGAVRDLLLGRELVDIDLAINGDPLDLARGLGGDPPAATEFGTVTVHAGELRYDIARTRRERYPQPGALPEVQPAEIEADLLRRDFTVNAIALGLLGSRVGEIVAAPQALDDLAHRRLAVLHPQSFLDDPTRLLRLARYAARLRFGVAPDTRELATQAIAAGALATISGHRLGNELRLLAAEPDPVAAIQAATELGLPWQIDTDVATRALAALPPDGRPDLLILTLAFSPPPSSRGDTAAQRGPLLARLDELGFAAADRDAIAEAATQAAEVAQRLGQARSGSEVAHAVGSAGAGTVALASALGPPEPAQRWLRELRHLRLQITGADLIEQGVPEGRALGRGLAAARDALLDDLAPDRGSQLAVALKAAR